MWSPTSVAVHQYSLPMWTKDGDDDDDDDMVTWMLDGVVGLGIHFQY